MNSTSQDQLTHLWQLVLELSSQLSSSREITAQLARHADTIAVVEASSAPDAVNGHQGNPNHRKRVPSDLQQELDKLREENGMLRQDSQEMEVLLGQYERALEQIIGGLRNYAHDRSNANIDAHRNYTSRIAAEQKVAEELKASQHEAQNKLSQVCAMLREAYKQDTTYDVEATLVALRLENRGLREVFLDAMPKLTLGTRCSY